MILNLKKIPIILIMLSLLASGCSTSSSQFSSRKIPSETLPTGVIDTSLFEQSLFAFCWRPRSASKDSEIAGSSSYIGIMRGDGAKMATIRHPDYVPSDSYKLGCLANEDLEQGFRALRPSFSWQPETTKIFFSGGTDLPQNWLYFAKIDESTFDVLDFDVFDSYKKYFFGINSIEWDNAGTRFAVHSQFDISPQGVGQNIWVYSPVSESAERITEYEELGNFVTSAVWSPDSTKLAIGLGDDTSGIEIVDLKNGNSVQVSSQEFSEIVGWPYRADSFKDVIIRLISSNPTGIFADYLMNSKPVWFNDGQELLFTAPTPDDRVALFAVSSSGDNLREVFPGLPGVVGYPTLSPNGSELVFIRYPKWTNTSKVELLIYSFKTETLGTLAVLPKPDNNSRLYISGLSWSPNGEGIAFSSNHEGQSNIYLISPDGDVWINLTSDMDGDAVFPKWKP